MKKKELWNKLPVWARILISMPVGVIVVVAFVVGVIVGIGVVLPILMIIALPFGVGYQVINGWMKGEQ